MIKLESVLYGFALETKDSTHVGTIKNYKDENERMPFFVSYTDPDTVCFTRKSKFESDLIREMEWFSL